MFGKIIAIVLIIGLFVFSTVNVISLIKSIRHVRVERKKNQKFDSEE